MVDLIISFRGIWAAAVFQVLCERWLWIANNLVGKLRQIENNQYFKERTGTAVKNFREFMIGVMREFSWREAELDAQYH